VGNKPWIFIWTTALGVTGLIVTVLGAANFVEFLKIGERGIWWLSILAVAGLLVFVAVPVYLGLRTSSRKIRDWQTRQTIYRTCKCHALDLKAIAEIASDEFGDRSTSEEQTLRLHSLDEKIFTAVKDSKEQIVGYFCLVRLTRAGAEAVMRNDFHIATAAVEYIDTSTKRKYKQVYIGAVYGRRQSSKMFALGSMINELTEMKPKLICARAATSDGLRVLKKYGFQPIVGRPAGVGELFCLKGQLR
jgi:hypothetical protein